MIGLERVEADWKQRNLARLRERVALPHMHYLRGVRDANSSQPEHALSKYLRHRDLHARDRFDRQDIRAAKAPA